MAFLNTVYTTNPANDENANVRYRATTPEVVAGYVRLVLTIIGTLATILPGLEVVGVPVSEWIRVVFGSTC